MVFLLLLLIIAPGGDEETQSFFFTFESKYIEGVHSSQCNAKHVVGVNYSNGQTNEYWEAYGGVHPFVCDILSGCTTTRMH